MLESHDDIDDIDDAPPEPVPVRVYQRCASCAEPWRGVYDETWIRGPRGPLHRTRICREMPLDGAVYAPGKLTIAP